MRIKPKVLFMGTPEFCVPTLKAIKSSEKLELDLVITQPDAPKGRKLKLHSSPVRVFSEANSIRVLTPQKISDSDTIEEIKFLNFDIAIVLAYGQLLEQNLLDVLPDRFVNIHASLLPRWRGAAPIQRSIMSGDIETGLSFQLMRLKLDTGPVIFEEKIAIGSNENSIELMQRLSKLSGECVERVILDYLKGDLKLQEQEESLATYAKKITKDEGAIDWNKSALEIHNQVRGLQWGPGAYTRYKSKRLKISQTQVDVDQEAEPGVVFQVDNNALFLGTGKGILKVFCLQPEGCSKMDVKAFVNGYGLTSGLSFLKS